MVSTTSRARSFTRSGDCFSSKAFAFRTPSGIFMYAQMRRPLLPRLVIGDIADRIDFEQGDVLDMPRVLQAIKKHQVTHVVHAAAFVGAVSAANPALSIQVNVMGTVNVLEGARLHRESLGEARMAMTVDVDPP